MQPITKNELHNHEIKKHEEELTLSDAISTALTITAVITTFYFHREIGEFLGFYAKKAVDSPDSLVATFNINSLNQYTSPSVQEGLILPRELPKLPALICSKVQEVAKNLCSSIETTTSDACSSIKDFCVDLPSENFIEKMGAQLLSIEEYLKKSPAFSSLAFQITIGLKKLSSKNENTKFFCIINPNENLSIVNSLKTHLHNLMNFAALQSSNITHGYIPAQHLQINTNNPMNRILHFGVTS